VLSGLKGVGKDPRLARAKSKNEKNISWLLNQIEAGKMGIHTFTNASAFTVNDTDVKIISIQFASLEQNHAKFFGQIIIDAVAATVSRSATASGNVMIHRWSSILLKRIRKLRIRLSEQQQNR